MCFGQFKKDISNNNIDARLLLHKNYIYNELQTTRYINISLDKLKYEKIFRRFSSQKKAIEYYQSLNSHFGVINTLGNDDDNSRILPIGVFAEETSSNGSRIYIVCSYEAIWYYFSSLSEDKRHLYELILENQPCWLYFDIEYNRKLYHFDENKILTTFVRHLKVWIYSTFGYSLENKNFIFLCSSSIEKFSYHVIVKYINIEKKFSTLFKDNSSMKIFIHHFLLYLKNKTITLDESSGIQLQDIIDTGVYTRNRCFRMLYSSKFGKKTALNIDHEKTSYDLSEITPIQLLRSMVTFLNIKHNQNYKYISKYYLVHFICINLNKFGITHQCDELKQISQKSIKCSEINNIPSHLVKVIEYVILFWNKIRDESHRVANFSYCSFDESEISNYCMDKISLDFCNKTSTNVQNYIYSALTIKESNLVIISVSKLNKLCLNVAREHNSNGIKLIISINKKRFYQKCFDPDCENYKSRIFNIPDRADISLFCENCRSDRVYIDPNTGEYFCEDCGIQQQEIRELDRDIDDIYFEISNRQDGKRSSIRRASQSTEKLPTREDQHECKINSEYSKDGNTFVDVSSVTYRTNFENWYNNKPNIIKSSDFLIGIQMIIQHIIKEMIERRQVREDVLNTSKKVWFLFLGYINRNKIPIRTIFADLRCSVLKVPFKETASKASKIKIPTKIDKISNSYATDSEKSLQDKIAYELLFNHFGINRIHYVSKIYDGIIKSSNSLNTKRKYGKFSSNEKHSLFEEWEISARKLHTIAKFKSLPYTNWRGESNVSRSEIIKSVIDMIYESDFLEHCFYDFTETQNGDYQFNKKTKFNNWIDSHVQYYLENKVIHEDFHFSISKLPENSENSMKMSTDTEIQLLRAHIVHMLINKLLGKYLKKIFSKYSLSKYVPFNFNKMLRFCNSKRKELDTISNPIPEYPKLDYTLILCIVWISLLKCGYQITSYDIINWLKDGKIDVFKSENVLPKWLKDAGFKWDNDINSSFNARSVTQLSRMPSHGDLDKTMRFFTHYLNVSVPPVNVPIYIHRILANCKILGYRGGIAIQPFCIQLWEFLLKENTILTLFSVITIAPSIIIVIARSIWPIFVYHCIPNFENKISEDSTDKLSIRCNHLENANSPTLECELEYNRLLSSWILNVQDQKSSKESKIFSSKIHGIEWSGILAVKWFSSYLSSDLKMNYLETNNLLEQLCTKRAEAQIERKGRPTTNFRGDFFLQTRKNRLSAKNRFGYEKWSGMAPIKPINCKFDDYYNKRLTTFSYYLPSNRETLNSILINSVNKHFVLLSGDSLQSWGDYDHHEKENIYEKWERILLSNKTTESSTLIKAVQENLSPYLNPSLFPIQMNENFIKGEIEGFDGYASMINFLFTFKYLKIGNIFQDPGVFTSIVLPLPQFFHSKQKFTNSEASLPAPYILLLLQLAEITGEQYLNIHSCVIKIEEIIGKVINRPRN
ncbi:Herpesviridae UL52/UL70 DNA primase family protein [Cryptosporidium felis]|nr:Herpesviridae UL52/UL70 DNA primase family protein [Cryptosporidium felis]